MYELIYVNQYSGKIMFSGNPIDMIVAVTSPTNNAQSIYVVVTIKVEAIDGVGVYNTIKTQKVFPNAEGVVSMDISSICNAQLEYFIPPATLDNYVSCKKQIRNFKIEYALFYNGSKVSELSDFVRVIKGGIPADSFLPDIGNIIDHETEQWLLASNFAERAYLDDVAFLYFSMPANNNYNYYVDARISYLASDDGIGVSTYKITDDIPVNGQTQVICIPIGFNALNMQAQLPAGVIPVSYSIIVGKKQSGKKPTKLQNINFTFEQRTFYHTKQLLYRSSKGSLMPVRIYGSIDTEGNYEFQNSNGSGLSYISNGSIIGGQKQYYSEESWKNSGFTGFITKFEAERLRDLFLSREKYEVVNGRLVPVIINNKSVKFWSNKDSLFSIQIEWVNAIRNNTFDLPYSAPEQCPAIKRLTWKQVTSTIIRVFWSLPSGYDYFRVALNFTGAATQYFFIEGNSGAQFIQFLWPDGVAAPADLTVTAQVMCNRYNKIPSFGAIYNAGTQTVVANLAAIAMPDSFNLSTGHTTAFTFSGSVLANDIDPSGRLLSCTPVTDQPTAQGGLISITADGIVSYTPPSGTFTGVDTFSYELLAGSDPAVNGQISITIAASNNPIYATTGYGSFSTNSFGEFVPSDIYIRFLNSPTGFIPYPVSNLSVNYRKTVTIYNSEDGYSSPISTVNTDITSVFNTGQMTVFTGPTVEYIEQPDFSYNKVVVSISILPGTGYTVI